jgi:hypothetical protein
MMHGSYRTDMKNYIKEVKLHSNQCPAKLLMSESTPSERTSGKFTPAFSTSYVSSVNNPPKEKPSESDPSIVRNAVRLSLPSN